MPTPARRQKATYKRREIVATPVGATNGFSKPGYLVAGNPEMVPAATLTVDSKRRKVRRHFLSQLAQSAAMQKDH
jgi:hypothetical protein